MSFLRLQSDAPATRTISLLGGLAASIFAITIPFLYLGLSVYALEESLRIETTHLAKAVEKIIQARPDLWEFEYVRLLEIISQPSIDEGLDERTIRTAAGTVVAKTDFSATSPAITVSAAFFDSGNPAGSIEARHSIRKQIIVTAILGILSSSLGCLFFFIFRTYPIRKLENALADLQRAEEEERREREEAERLAEEMAVIAEIGRVIGSTLETDEVYERFAAEAKKLIPFDRLAVNLHSLHEENVKVAYVSGEEVSGRRKGDLFPLKGSIGEVLIKTRAGLLDYPKNVEEMHRQFHNHVATVQAGERSLVRVPLIYRDEVIGSLNFRLNTPNAYTDRDLRLAEGIGSQIAGAIASAQLYKDLKKTETSLRESEKGYHEISIKLQDAYSEMRQKKDKIEARKYIESIIFLTADDGRICGFTEEAAGMTKKSHYDLQGCNIQDILVFQEGQTFMDLIHKVRPRMAYLTTLRFKNQIEDGPSYEAKLTCMIVEGKKLFYIVLY